ncbi:MAG: hypothetical protein ACR2QF_11035 [Geminicoccaceae bacterium]
MGGILPASSHGYWVETTLSNNPASTRYGIGGSILVGASIASNLYQFSIYKDSSNDLSIRLDTDRTIRLVMRYGGTVAAWSTTGLVTLNAWNHVFFHGAFGDGGTNESAAYINGVKETNTQAVGTAASSWARAYAAPGVTAAGITHSNPFTGAEFGIYTPASDAAADTLVADLQNASVQDVTTGRIYFDRLLSGVDDFIESGSGHTYDSGVHPTFGGGGGSRYTVTIVT